MTSIFKRTGFTLIELLVVICMIGLISAAVTTSVRGAQERARIQKALTEVKAISQAILALENYRPSHDLPTIDSPAKLSGQLLEQLLGRGAAANGDRIPVLLQASLMSGSDIRDPWGHPYKVSIRKGKIGSPGLSNLRTGFMLPNFHRLSKGERQ